MKTKFVNDMLVIYLYNIKLNLSNNIELTKDIKSIFRKIIKYYGYELSGMYEIIVYENKYYGYILEINKIKNFEYGDFIDIKINIKNNQDFYMKVENYYFVEGINHVSYKNKCYYVNIKELKNVNIIFEYGDILYKDCDKFLNDCVNVCIKNVN